MKKLITMAMLLLITLSASAQEKKFFTPADASYNNRSLYAQRPNQLKWVGESGWQTNRHHDPWQQERNVVSHP